MEREALMDIGHDLRGTCETLASYVARKELDIDPEDLEDELLNVSTETCPVCEWWMESCDLVDEDGEPCPCEQCREKNDDRD